MRDFDDELDRTIGARFGALNGSVAAAVPLPGAEEIIARGRRRRRNGQAALGGLGVLGLLAAVTVIVGPLRLDGAPLPPVDPTLTASRVPYVPPPGAGRAPLGTTIPAGFLPVEGAVTTARLEPLCAGTASLPTNASIISSAAGDGVTLVVYTTSTRASRAYDEYRAEAVRCAVPDPATALTVEPLTFGGQAFKVVTAAGAQVTGYQAVVRYGRALLLVRGPDENAVRRAGDLERSLCVFAVDCTARAGRPKPVAPMTAGGEAWAAVLAIDAGEGGGADAQALGRAVAVASEMGYRTSVASIDCDDGARRALGLPAGSAHRYVAVYFDSRSDAEAFATSSMLYPVATIQVRTYCLA